MPFAIYSVGHLLFFHKNDKLLKILIFVTSAGTLFSRNGVSQKINKNYFSLLFVLYCNWHWWDHCKTPIYSKIIARRLPNFKKCICLETKILFKSNFWLILNINHYTLFVLQNCINLFRLFLCFVRSTVITTVIKHFFDIATIEQRKKSK